MVNTIQFGILLPIPFIHTPLQAEVLSYLEGELQSLDVISNPVLHEAKMLVSGISVITHTQPGRIDLTAFQANDPSAPLNRDLNYDDAVTILRDAVVKIAVAAGASRLAIITNVAEICESAAEASRHIAEHVNGISVPASATDLDLRINVRLPQSADAVPINRLLRWQGLTQSVLTVPAEGIATTALQHGAFCQIDVNTAPEFTLTPDQLGPTYDLLVSTARPLLEGFWSAL